MATSTTPITETPVSAPLGTETETEVSTPITEAAPATAPLETRITSLETRQDEQWRAHQEHQSKTNTTLETINQSLTKMAETLTGMASLTQTKSGGAVETTASPVEATPVEAINPKKLPKSAVAAVAKQSLKPLAKGAATLASQAKKVTFI